MNTLFRTKGWVTDANVITPKQFVTTPQNIYSLRLQPENPSIYQELEEAATRLKHETATQQGPWNQWNGEPTYHEDKLFDGSEILFESFFQPSLEGEFEQFDRDESLLGKAVQAVGHLQILEDLNVFLSVHILEPATTLDGFDPLD